MRSDITCPALEGGFHLRLHCKASAAPSAGFHQLPDTGKSTAIPFQRNSECRQKLVGEEPESILRRWSPSKPEK